MNQITQSRPAATTARNIASAKITGPDITENDRNIAAMKQQADTMQSLSQQPQHLAFADPGNRSRHNANTGIQLDIGNLPSSKNQLTFAANRETKAQRTDARLAAAMNPSYYNGIKISNAAVARNKTLSPSDQSYLSGNGWQVSPEGVVQRQPRKQTGGQPIGYGSLSDTARQLAKPAPATQQPTESLAQIAERVGQSRAKYGMAPDGSSPTVSGRENLINARTDLTEDQKQDYIDTYQKRQANRPTAAEARGVIRQQFANQRQAAYENNLLGNLAIAAMNGSQPAAKVIDSMIQSGSSNLNSLLDHQATKFLAESGLLPTATARQKSSTFSQLLPPEQQAVDPLIDATSQGKDYRQVIRNQQRTQAVESLLGAGEIGNRLLSIPPSKMKQEFAPSSRAEEWIERLETSIGPIATSGVPADVLRQSMVLEGIDNNALATYLEEIERDIPATLTGPDDPNMRLFELRDYLRTFLGLDADDEGM